MYRFIPSSEATNFDRLAFTHCKSKESSFKKLARRTEIEECQMQVWICRVNNRIKLWKGNFIKKYNIFNNSDLKTIGWPSKKIFKWIFITEYIYVTI